MAFQTSGLPCFPNCRSQVGYIPRARATYSVREDTLLTCFTFSPPVSGHRGDLKVSGIVTFDQTSESSPTTITYDISGNDSHAQRGMHVHQFGDNTNGCTSAGPHCMSFYL